jgi:hypothetical protein
MSLAHPLCCYLLISLKHRERVLCQREFQVKISMQSCGKSKAVNSDSTHAWQRAHYSDNPDTWRQRSHAHIYMYNMYMQRAALSAFARPNVYNFAG